MNKRKIQKKLNAFIDGELNDHQAKEVELAIQHNTVIRAEYERLISLNSLLDQQNIKVTDNGFLYRLNTRLAFLHSNPPRRQGYHNWLIKFAMPAAVCAGLLAGILMGIEINQIMNTNSAQQKEIARQYIDNNALPVIPDDSITAGYIQLSSHVSR